MHVRTLRKLPIFRYSIGQVLYKNMNALDISTLLGVTRVTSPDREAFAQSTINGSNLTSPTGENRCEISYLVGDSTATATLIHKVRPRRIGDGFQSNSPGRSGPTLR